MSKISSNHTIIQALIAGLEFVNAEQWKPVNEEQKVFLEKYSKLSLDLSNIKEIQTFISDNANELNEILKKQNFSIQLEKFSENEFGIVAILDMLFKWINPGIKIKIFANNNYFDGFNIEDFFSIKKVDNQIIVCLATKNQDLICFSMVDEEKNWLEKIESLYQKKGDNISSYDSVDIPMVDLTVKQNISFLKNLTCFGNNSEWKISQALQESILKINQYGARAKSAVAMGMMKCAGVLLNKETFKINKPFLFWVERKNVKYPIFSAYVSYEDWKKPESID